MLVHLHWRWVGSVAAVLWLLLAEPVATFAPSGPNTVTTGMPAMAGPIPSFLDDGWVPVPGPGPDETHTYVDTRLVRERVLAASRSERPRNAVSPPASPVRQASEQVSAPSEAPPLPLSLQWPLNGSYVSSTFGARGGVLHEGIDLPHNHGHPIVAAAAGIVVASGWNGGYGYSVILDHGNSIRTRYAHASQLLVANGDAVESGQQIALVGNTGHSYGNHLHFEVIVGGIPRNPLAYLP